MDCTVIASSGTRIITLSDESSLGYSFQVRPWARFTVSPGRFAPIGDTREVFEGLVPCSIISLTGPLQYVSNRVYLIIPGFSKPRQIIMNLATS